MAAIPTEHPPHWPLNPDQWQSLDEGIAKCDEVDELCRRMRSSGYPADAFEESARQIRGMLEGTRHTHFPNVP